MPLLLASLLASLAAVAVAQPAWQPIPDTPYMQEVGRQLHTDTPALAIGIFGDSVYVAFANGIRRIDDTTALTPLPDSPANVTHLMGTADGLFAIAPDGLYRFSTDWIRLAERKFVDMTQHAGRLIVAASDNLYVVEGDTLMPLPGGAEAPMAIAGVTSAAETLYCMSPDRVLVFNNGAYTHEDLIGFGSLPAKDLRDILGFGSRLLIATHFGMGTLQGDIARQIVGANGLPVNECHVLATGFANDYWIGTPQGAIRALEDGYHYFQGPRWLPSDRVNAIAASGTSVFIATDGGIGIIDYIPFTLRKKADYYEKHLTAWGQKRMAFTHKLEWDAASNTWMREVSDNDVGWSTHWWAAMAFKYAVTKDEAARQHAIDGFNAMKWSEEITPIDGFPARAIWAVGETGHQAEGGSGGYAAEWHRTPDDKWEWKGDTSSDEIDAHYYYASIFYDLVADDSLKQQVRDHVSRIASHLIDNGWVLRDFDGKPTVWGRWDLEYLDSPRGRYAWGLNGMEALNYMHTTYALTQASKFREAYEGLIEKNYTREIILQKLISPPPFVFHSDDRLAFYTYYTLLKHAAEPHLRSIYRRSLERSWEIERIERNPWFNFLYCAITGNPAELAQATDHLRAWPLDLVEHAFDHRERDDLDSPAGYLSYTGGDKPISPRERGGYRWSSDPFELASHNGQSVLDPSGWLDAYWMGRQYGFILPPETEDPDLLEAPPIPIGGAAPYDGPPMPHVLD